MIHIGKILKADYEASGLHAGVFAEKIGTSRSNLYSLFRRRSMDSQTLYQISLSLGKDYFQYYTDELKAKSPKDFQAEEPGMQYRKETKKVLVEVEISDLEYQELKKKIISHNL